MHSESLLHEKCNATTEIYFLNIKHFKDNDENNSKIKLLYVFIKEKNIRTSSQILAFTSIIKFKIFT